ncbi:MAG: MBL fold metallo-hydrolase [Thermoplasmata archaeon]|jgi:glyoxylase-like metal-dependent hydrolase (beta-lactamase superfamily II)
MSPPSLSLRRSAIFEVLCAGYVGDRVASTVSCVEEGDVRAILDPGMVASRDNILKPLARRGVRPSEITDIVLSHHHPDRTLNVALFPCARVHDFWAVYENDVWTSRPGRGIPPISLGRSLGDPRAHAPGRYDPGRHEARDRGVHPPLVERAGSDPGPDRG